MGQRNDLADEGMTEGARPYALRVELGARVPIVEAGALRVPDAANLQAWR